MPNGDPDFDVAAEAAWFAPIAPVLEAFASRHNLRVDKYYHHESSWAFRFNHPRGGQASITVHHCRSGDASVDSIWYVDDYDTFTRSIYRRDPRDVSKTESDLQRESAAELAAILSAPPNSWSQIASGYASVWSQFTRAQFEGMKQRLPDPIP